MTNEEIKRLYIKSQLRPDRFWGRLIDWILTMEQCSIGFDVLPEDVLIDLASILSDCSSEVDKILFEELDNRRN